MSRALIIGAGGVAGVVMHKCCQNSEVFTDICIASRTKSKCDKFKEELQDKTKTNITTAQVNADNVPELVALMKEYKPDICINVALPYQDLHIMDACLECKVIMLTQQTMSQRTLQSLNISGSGLIERDLKKLVSQRFSDLALTQV